MTPMYNPMAGVSPGRMAEARRFAQGGQMGRARQQFELGGGQWNPQVQGMMGQQDSIGQVMPDGGMGGGPQEQIGGGMGGPQDMVQPGGPGGPPQWGAFPGFGGGMGGGMGGGRPGGGLGAFPNIPPRFHNRPPSGWGNARPGMGGPGGMPGGGMGGGYGGPVPAVMPGYGAGGGGPVGGFGGGRERFGGFGGRPEAGPPIRRHIYDPSNKYGYG